MKKVLSIILYLVIYPSAFSQNTFPASGNVGIGTNSPTDPLHIYESVSAADTTLRLDAATNKNPNLLFSINGVNAGNIRINDSGSDELQFMVGSSLLEAITIKTNGFVGMNATNPNSPLTIEGSNNTSIPDIRINSSNSMIKLGENKQGPHGLIFGDDQAQGLQLFYRTDPNIFVLEKANNASNGVDLFSIDYDTEYAYFKGNVGIGTENPDTKLVVDGKIRSEEIKVEIINGPDYVFNDDYKLPSLDQVRKYIEKNRHLPEIPSAKEMEKEGVALGDMNMKLLKKIEELTLYQIQLLDELKKQKNRMKRLETLLLNKKE